MMSDKANSSTDAGQPMVYQVRIRGHLDTQWTDWFEGLKISLEDNGDTLLTGPVADQAALYGLLRKVRDLGLPLISVICVEPGPSARLEPRASLVGGQTMTAREGFYDKSIDREV
jgi:hypothetical protein